ncbi:hypothetical protein SAMN06265361_101259 [Laceyella tengchongensis]|uniref:Uncharacterized protein n=1 Tax=Laceyella tengchongensis TaxID=574699 RepID=A0AA45WIZ7_9BACL|nr:hypothetical protein [Laceyella tengchongensis]SMP01524.1 hypothetical protein SAMN06265361_101259 [Laceyella tengchongensis]
MSRNKFFSSREQFEEWLFFQSDVVENFVNEFDYLNLDFSPESLIRLEQWILEKHPSPQSLIKDEKAEILDSILRYVGQVYVKQLKGKWNVVLNDPQYVYYSMPIVTTPDDMDVSPFSEIVASSDRRRGDYMYTVFIKKKRRMEENGLL